MRTRQTVVYFVKQSRHQSRDISEYDDLYSYQILSSLTKLKRRRRPASERDKFLSGVKN